MGVVVFWSVVGLISGMASLVLIEETVFGPADQRPRNVAWLAFCAVVIVIARDFVLPLMNLRF